MEKERDSSKKIKGLISFISSMEHHYTGGIRAFLYATKPEEIEKSFKEISARTQGLEADLRTARGAVGKMRTIAKKRVTKI